MEPRDASAARGVPRRHPRRPRLRRGRGRRRALVRRRRRSPLMGSVAPIVMSVFVFAGSAQFGATAVLAAGRQRGHRDRDRRDAERALPADGHRRGAGPARRPAAARARGPGDRRRLLGAGRPRRGRLRPRGCCSAPRFRSTRPGCSAPRRRAVRRGARRPGATSGSTRSSRPSSSRCSPPSWAGRAPCRWRCWRGAIALALTPLLPAGLPVLLASTAALIGLWRR